MAKSESQLSGVDAKAHKNEADIKSLRHDLDNKSDETARWQDDMKAKIDALETQGQYHQGKILDIENKLLLLKTGGGGADLEAFEEIIENLKADMRERFVKVPDFNEFKEELDQKLKKHDDKLEDHEERIVELENKKAPDNSE